MDTTGYLIRHDALMGGAPASRLLPGDQVVGGDVAETGNLLEKRSLTSQLSALLRPGTLGTVEHQWNNIHRPATLTVRSLTFVSSAPSGTTIVPFYNITRVRPLKQRDSTENKNSHTKTPTCNNSSSNPGNGDSNAAWRQNFTVITRLCPAGGAEDHCSCAGNCDCCLCCHCKRATELK